MGGWLVDSVFVESELRKKEVEDVGYERFRTINKSNKRKEAG